MATHGKVQTLERAIHTERYKHWKGLYTRKGTKGTNTGKGYTHGKVQKVQTLKRGYTHGKVQKVQTLERAIHTERYKY